MDKIILLYLFSLFGLVTKVNSQLHCFECTNCPNVNELDTNMIQNCDLGSPDITTIEPATTTIEPDFTTIEPGTTTTEPEVTTITTTTTTTGITTQTPPSEIPTTTSQIPTSSDDTTTGTTDDGIPTTLTTPLVPPTTTSQTPGPPPVMGHNYRRFMQKQLGGHQCYIIHRRVGEAVQVNRGCTITRENEDVTCSAANLGEPYEYCSLCAHNECNIGSKYVVSLTVFLSSLFIALVIN